MPETQTSQPDAPLEAVVGLTQEEVNDIYTTYDQVASVGPEQKYIRANIQAKVVQAVQNVNALAAMQEQGEATFTPPEEPGAAAEADPPPSLGTDPS